MVYPRTDMPCTYVTPDSVLTTANHSPSKRSREFQILEMSQSLSCRNFTSRTISITSQTPKKLIQFCYFRDPEDVDLIVGALLENAAPGTVFGPTISCIMALQFTHVRTSDRFWYENDIPPSSLSIEQLQSIRKTSLSGLLCSSSGVSRSQPKAFFREDIFL